MGQKEEVTQQAAESKKLGIALQSIADLVDDGLLAIDREYRVWFANRVMQQRLSQDDQALQGKRCYEVFESRDTPCHSPLWVCPLPKVLQSESPTTIIHPNYSPGSDAASKRYIKNHHGSAPG